MTDDSCMCGAVRCEVTGPFSLMPNCHCSMCLKHHGTTFATFVVAPIDGFEWQSGQREIAAYASSARGHRHFCRIGGSVVPGLVAEPGIAILPPGSLEGDLDVRPSCTCSLARRQAGWRSLTKCRNSSKRCRHPDGLG